MVCSCASKGQIPACPESPIVKLLIPLGVTIASLVFAKLPTQGKILVGSVGAVGLSYVFNLHEKINNMMAFQYKEEGPKPASMLADFDLLEYNHNSKDIKIKTIDDGEYKGLSLFKCSVNNDVITVTDQYMHKVDGYITEVQEFDPLYDIIQINSGNDNSIHLTYKDYNGLNYTIIYTENLQLAVQGEITQASIEII